MFASRLRTPVLALGAALSLSACAYGYGGLDVGYGGYNDGYYNDGYGGYGQGGYYDVNSDPFYSGRYGYTPQYGWYNNYFYPGTGYYIYDRRGSRYGWNDDQRRYWERNRVNIRSREDLRDYRDYRRENRGDIRDYRNDRREDRDSLRNGTITQDQFRANRRDDRRDLRQDVRQNRRELRQDLRNENPDQARHREIREEVRQHRAERRQRGD